MLDMKKIAESIGLHVCQALIGMHSYNGCDNVSSFAGKGKLSALKILDINKYALNSFVKLGQEWEVSEHIMNGLESFTCLLHGGKSNLDNKIDYSRYH